MYLKKLELTGFKSFANKTELSLSKGLNAVVGPNGSGKSNIADALRWVLGEQSAKQLRGGKMEDVIFAGSAHRKPLSFADITMKMSNEDKGLPLDFNEVTVTRRVYRSGESEYLINGEICRLKDIQMLFMDTGIGRDGYSIIGQGRVDEILSLKSEDRRHIFEEAAGISKYKARRNETLNKLEREKQNRKRVDDIISELNEQLEPLEIEAEEAKKYLLLRDEYKSIHVNIFLSEISRITLELEQTEEALKTGRLNSEDEKFLLIEARQIGEILKQKISESELKYRHQAEIVLETTKAIEQKQNEINLLNQSLNQNKADITRLKSEFDKRKASIFAKNEEKESENLSLEKVQKELEALNIELSNELKISYELEEELRKETESINKLNAVVMERINAQAKSLADVLDEEKHYNRLEEDKERLNIEIEHHESNLETKKSSIKKSEEDLFVCQNELEKAKKSEDSYEAAYGNLSRESKEIELDLRKNQENLTALRGRYRALMALESGHEGYYKSVKAVLAKKNADPRFKGICGAVSELIGVKKEYEVAIEIALGGAAQNIITQTEEDAKLSIEMLKSNREGRATFLPLTAIKGKNIDLTRVKSEPGFISLASNLVETEETYKNIITHLLGDIIIIDNINNALLIHKKYKYQYKIVTLSGERLSPGGAITGGSRQNAVGIVGRSRQLEELKTQVAFVQKIVDELQTKEQNLSAKRQTTMDTLNRTKELTQSLSLKEQSIKIKISAEKESLKAQTDTISNCYEENDTLMKKIIESNKSIRELKTLHKSFEESHVNALKNLEDYKKQIEENRKAQSDESDTITEFRIEISRRTEWSNGFKKNILRLEREINMYNEEKQLLKREMEAIDAKNIIEESKSDVALNELEKLKSYLKETNLELEKNEKEKSALDAQISKAESNERSQIDAVSLLEKELTRLEIRKEHLDNTSHRLHNEIWEEYNLTYQNAQILKRNDISENTLRRESSRLKQELGSMKNVNIGAIETFKQLKTRHDFLEAQRNDIVEAEAALHELTLSLTSQMTEQFTKSFKEITIHFQEVFREMFGGGNASLRLLDMDNILESGIEITAQPPGKSLQNLLLLSGGERALTAIALLFAILRLKPSPFCVLDEIESALDDANVTRFANFLKTYANTTQFIVITHRKGTMEAAEHLYGVTMEEQGISKLVSVKFVDE